MDTTTINNKRGREFEREQEDMYGSVSGKGKTTYLYYNLKK